MNGAAERALYEYVVSLPSTNKREGMRHPPPAAPPPFAGSQEKESRKKGGKGKKMMKPEVILQCELFVCLCTYRCSFMHLHMGARVCLACMPAWIASPI